MNNEKPLTDLLSNMKLEGEEQKTPLATLLLRMLCTNTWYSHYGVVRSEEDKISIARLIEGGLVISNGEEKNLDRSKLKYQKIINI